MRMNPYLTFKGDCEAAFKFYEGCLGGEVLGIFRYAGSPLEASVPGDWSDKVMHATLAVGEQLLQGYDAAPDQYEEARGISLTLQIPSISRAERIFLELATGGTVTMALQET